jgi:hypothetical protein
VKVAALVPDLLFGSKLVAMFHQAGHELMLVDALSAGHTQEGDPIDALIVDLTVAGVDVEAIGRSALPTLGFYAHIDPAIREAALAAGFDLVVPRSRMAREGVALLERLIAA